MTGYIYCHISPSNKKYIGQTTTSLEHHFCNGENYKSSPVFWKAIQKYGWNNFQHIVLHKIEAESKEELLSQLNRIEREEIELNNCLAPHGYNIEKGGGQGRVTSEKRQQISDTLLVNGAPTKEELYYLYCEKNKTMKEIGNILQMTRNSVSKWLKWYDIPVQYHHRNHKRIDKETFETYYLFENHTQKECAQHFQVSLSVIASYIRKYNLYKRKVE